MNEFLINPIGKFVNNGESTYIQLYKEYAAGLKGLNGFSHAVVLWWADGCDNAEGRAVLTEEKPYTNGPESIGVFATRSPERPNPIALSVVDVAYVDDEAGIMGLYYTDAFDGTAVIDIKPYTPSIDRVESPRTPTWCAHWPKSCETSGDFDWASEFNF